MARQDLTARQEAFALEYAKTRSVAKSYRASYRCEGLSERDVDRRGREVLNVEAVRQRVDALICEAAAPTVFTIQQILTRLVGIVMADPNELISVKVGNCRYCRGEAHAYQWREREYVEALDKAEREAATTLPDPSGGFGFNETLEPVDGCPECHGEGVPRVVIRDTENLSPNAMLLYGGVKQTRNGLEIIMADRMKAMEMVGRIIGAFNDKLQINGKLEHVAEVVQTNYTDPNEAARAYQDMITKSGLAADTKH